jgi:hypothetical protein
MYYIGVIYRGRNAKKIKRPLEKPCTFSWKVTPNVQR